MYSNVDRHHSTTHPVGASLPEGRVSFQYLLANINYVGNKWWGLATTGETAGIFWPACPTRPFGAARNCGKQYIKQERHYVAWQPETIQL